MQFNILDSISDLGSHLKTNEDLIFTDQDLIVVFDGATGLGKKVLPYEYSDATWFVRELAKQLKHYWRGDFKEALAKSHDQTVKAFNLLIKGQTLAAHEYPSTGLVALCKENGKVVMYRLGDCASFTFTNAVTAIFEKSDLEYLDDISIAKMQSYIEQGLSFKGARKKLTPTLIKHRSSINQEGGYQALSLASSKIGVCEQVLITEETEEQRILLASDGFSALFHLYKPDLCVDNNVTLKALLDEIREFENNDLNLTLYPRLKPHDDATAVLVLLEK